MGPLFQPDINDKYRLSKEFLEEEKRIVLNKRNERDANYEYEKRIEEEEIDNGSFRLETDEYEQLWVDYYRYVVFEREANRIRKEREILVKEGRKLREERVWHGRDLS